MFGRSGQMFPRQRAFHDAIYEEEYGSDQEDECCQSRGMSAVFCWFLSVIILIGLAASVVLTVFFILKSKSHMSKNGELDLFLDGDHGISYHMPDTTTELNSNLDFSSSAASSKEASIPSSMSIEDDDNNDETENNIQFGTLNKSSPKSSTSTTTRFPPSRKGPTEISDEKVLRTDSPKSSETTKASSELSRSSSTSRESTTEKSKSDESKSNESTHKHTSSTEDHQATVYTTTTTEAPVQQILFTSSPDILVTPTGHRRNLQTTRFPTGRTSFSTSTPPIVPSDNEDDNEHKDEENNKSDRKQDKDDHEHNHDEDEDDDDDNENTDEDETQEESHLTLTTRHEDPTTIPTTIAESRERTTTQDSYKSEESQLNKMLLDEIPPHNNSEPKEEEDSPEEIDSSEEETSHTPVFSSEFNLPITTTSSATPPVKEVVPIDPLARLIKNLAPKWGRNRTVETTTQASGSHRYDFTISSREKDKSKSSKESTTPDFRSKSKYKTKETSTRSTLVVTPESGRIKFQRPSASNTQGPQVETVSILNTIQSPDLSRRHDQEPETSEGVGQFLDVLVGSEDHKSLITKQTEDGIVTSAILPPWFNSQQTIGKVAQQNSTSTTTSTTTNTTPPPVTHPTGETSSEEEGSFSASASDEGNSDTASVFGGLFDLFKKEMSPSTSTSVPNVAPGNSPDYDPKRIILKRPGGELLAQGTNTVAQNSGGNTNGISNADKIQRKPALSFRDLIRSAAPGLLSTTTIATLDPAVVTDDIAPANNGFHYNSPDGGTNIYGYYPDDDDKESDKTVEHMGIQSESMSDEIIDRAHTVPSHSIEVQVPDDSAEIVIEHANESSDSKFGETQAQSQNHGKYVEPPIFHGGGIRRPLEEDEDLHTHGDLEVNSSETHAVFAVPYNSSAPSNPKNSTGDAAHKVSYVNPSPVISGEVVDNSAEKDPSPNSEGITGSMEYDEQADQSLVNPKNPQTSSVENNANPQQSSVSYEDDLTSGAHEESHTKWSERDKYGSTETEADHQEGSLIGSEEVKVKPDSGDTNDVLERKLVVHLDDKLYPDSSDVSGATGGGASLQSGSEEAKVHQVFPEGHKASSSTTERPSGESTISEPEGSEAIKSNESKGFVPPTPVSFHDNKYTFSPPPPESIYQSKDGWRPIMKKGEDSSRPVSTIPPFWRTRQPILIPTRLTTTPTTQNTNNKEQVDSASHQLLEEDEEYEDEPEEDVGEGETPSGHESSSVHEQDLKKYPWGNREQLNNQPQNHPPSAPPSKVKFPEQTHEDFEQDIEPQPQRLQVQQQHLQLQPHPQVQIQQQSPPPQTQQQNQHHQQQPPPPQQHRPMSHQHPHQRQIPKHFQRQQFLYQNNPNIDRSKYLMRPAPPPIVMRRAPIQSMPYLPTRDGPGRQGLVAQIPPQPSGPPQNDPPPPSEFQQQYNLRRRFKTLGGARPRSNLNNWPTEDDNNDQQQQQVAVNTNAAERRSG